MDRRIQKTRAAILEAYISLVSGKKVKKITVSEVSKEANIDRKTFYAHFNCVDDILREFWEERIKELIGQLKNTDFFREPINLAIIFEELNHIIERDMEFYRQLAMNVNFRYFWNQIHDIVVHALVDAYGQYIDLPEDELKLYSDFFVAGLIRLYQDYLTNPGTISGEMMGKVVVDIAEHGITGVVKKD